MASSAPVKTAQGISPSALAWRGFFWGLRSSSPEKHLWHTGNDAPALLSWVPLDATKATRKLNRLKQVRELEPEHRPAPSCPCLIFSPLSKTREASEGLSHGPWPPAATQALSGAPSTLQWVHRAYTPLDIILHFKIYISTFQNLRIFCTPCCVAL